MTFPKSVNARNVRSRTLTAIWKIWRPRCLPEIIQRYPHVEHLTREMVEILIDYITVGKRVPGTQDVPIEIHWNF